MNMQATGKKQYVINLDGGSKVQLVLNVDGSVAFCTYLPELVGDSPYNNFLSIFGEDLTKKVETKSEYLPEFGEQCPVWE